MQSTTSLSTSTSSPLSRRTLLLFLLLYTTYRHRHYICNHIHSSFRPFRRLFHTLTLVSTLFSHVTSDLHHYLHPPSRRRNPSSVHTSIPPSIRRLLRLVATPHSLAILHHLARGLAQGVIASKGIPRALPDSLGLTQPRLAIRRMQDGGGVHEIVDALATPAGQTVVSTVVSSVVREGVIAMQAAKRMESASTANGGAVSARPAAEVVMDGLLSEGGRTLVVDVAGAVVKAVVPTALESMKSGGEGGNEGGVNGIVSGLESPPMRRKRVGSFGGVGGESPVSRQLVLSMMQAPGGCGVMERLALLAIRDKELVRELVRTVVGEGVRTYLTTQNEMRGKGKGKVGGKIEGGEGGSLWRVFVMSAVVDLKRALLRIGRKGSTGWIVF